MSGGLSVLAVDDERTQLDDLARMLGQSGLVGEVDVAGSGDVALDKLNGRRYDALFLDVRMPGLDGLELARVLQRAPTPPALVFVTAYESPAVEAFALRALDYLLKPVSRARLEEAIARVRQAGAAPASAVPEDELVAVASPQGGSIRLLRRSTILYVQSYGDFVRPVTGEGHFLLRATLAEIERRWAPHGFFRVHRQYVANLSQATELRPQLGGTATMVLTDGHLIPVARRHAVDLSRRLGL